MTEAKKATTYCIFDPTQTKICPEECKLNWAIAFANEIGSKFNSQKEPDITLLPECKLENEKAN